MSRPLLLVFALLLGACSSGGDEAVDVGFLQDMIDHHEQAVRMSLIVLAKDDVSPVTRAFAVDVVASQRYEIGFMEANLVHRGESKGAPDRDVMAWMDMPVPLSEMPGLATRAELEDLAAATGRDADEQFFGLMVEHHEGGLHMADHAVLHAEDEIVRDLADRIVQTQTREIAEMEQAQKQLGLT